MSSNDAVSAWKDRAYRRALAAAQGPGLPAHPAGSIEVADERLEYINAGFDRSGMLHSTLHCSLMPTCNPVECHTTQVA